MPTVVFYISGHGLGHASRQTEIIRALRHERPNVEVVVKTSAPRWFFEQAQLDRIMIEPFEPDTGVSQIDSLRVNVVQSIDRCDSFHRTLQQRAEREATDLQKRDAKLVVGDIPPLACAAGAIAGLPTIAIGNFTWDWIYDNYPETAERAPSLVNTLADAYAGATAAWRLPLHSSFEAFDNVVDVPIVARRSTKDPSALRDILHLPRDRKLALFSFGRYGIGGINWSHVQKLRGYHVIFTTQDRNKGGPNGATFTTLDELRLATVGITYADVMAAVDIVITKPGFGMISECAANDTAMLYTDRGRFPEYAVLVAGMSAMIRSAHIGHDELFSGCWQDHLDELLSSPRPDRNDLSGATILGRKLAGLI